MLFICRFFIKVINRIFINKVNVYVVVKEGEVFVEDLS